MPTYAFCGEQVWRPPDKTMPTFRVSKKSWDEGLSAKVSFVTDGSLRILKKTGGKFLKKIISAIS
jgi:hypothetical protein